MVGRRRSGSRASWSLDLERMKVTHSGGPQTWVQIPTRCLLAMHPVTPLGEFWSLTHTWDRDTKATSLCNPGWVHEVSSVPLT